ncbi:MAG: DUF1727 domain-containing protein [Candidatus Viridilinea halotolerans]|uniref:Lipid II isoglutaminyl synthase (glutamine-hydrolyzing) subunit MurT n=1 Tax=Candidatus Viridilinea halotolerans TaxID=2491704 RepID=A0A426U5I6_9CHLR|nr:MAG: DUF1727 domain-containing protein [Candidatus Viridilinea halotolerans]
MRHFFAIHTGKLAGQFARRLRLGGGTNLPGTLARRIAPNVLQTMSQALPQGVVLLSGTNGKTTTSRMVADMLRYAGLSAIHNRAGANLIEGITTTALAATSWRGQAQAQLALFEVDEAALPQAITETRPRLVVIHNLFRDQLDRYGELDTIANAWRVALAGLPPCATVLLNADDPAVADLGRDLNAQVSYYGMEDVRHATGSVAHNADSQFCRRCGQRYSYPCVFYAHIGHYYCPACGHQRPQPQVTLERLELQGAAGSQLYLRYPGGALELRLPLPGLYNAHNATAAFAAALALGLTPAVARNALEQFSAAFGRIERVDAGGTPLLIALIKNPVGASETVRMLFNAGQHQQPDLHLLIVINDRLADGTDVSWLWDADFELLANGVAQITVGGTRAHDMAVRLKYAGVDPVRLTIAPALHEAFDHARSHTPPEATLFALPTYTAMLELRALLAARGWVQPFWEV